MSWVVLTLFGAFYISFLLAEVGEFAVCPRLQPFVTCFTVLYIMAILSWIVIGVLVLIGVIGLVA